VNMAVWQNGGMEIEAKKALSMLKTTLRLPADLLREAKIYGVKTDATLQEVVEAALRAYLARKGKEGVQ